MLVSIPRPFGRERKFCSVFAAIIALVATGQSVRAVTPEAAPLCETLGDVGAADLAARIDAALKSRHPDHVTRLFASDAAMKGFASPVIRGDYSGIRDYFLYFLQFEPTLTFEGRQIETGCNFAIDTGTYVWTLKPRNAEASDTHALPTRYRMTIEKVGGAWQISELIEDVKPANAEQASTLFTLPAPPMVRAAGIAQTVPAVAGFLKRKDETSEGAAMPTAISKSERPSNSSSRNATDGDTPTEDPTHKFQRWFDFGR